LGPEPKLQPPAEAVPEEQGNAQATSPEGTGRTQQRVREEAETSMREDLKSTSREAVEKSEVREQEAAQPGPPAAPESRAGAKELPIQDYDSLTTGQITNRLAELSGEQIKRLRDYSGSQNH